MAVDSSLEDAQLVVACKDCFPYMPRHGPSKQLREYALLFATDFLRRFAALLSSVHLAQSVSVINIKVKC
jgi:hypothetical protein